MKSRWILLALVLCVSFSLACSGAEFLMGEMWYPRSFAVTLGDVDGDGDLDAFIANGHTDDTGEDNTVWLNDGTGNLSDSGQRLGDPCCNSNDSRAVVLKDLDDDGDLDAFVGNHNGYDAVWLNDGRGNLISSGQTLISGRSTLNGAAVALGDLDGDGDLDAYVGDCCRMTFVNPPGLVIDPYSTVWLNDGNGKFSDSGQLLGPSETHAVALGDLDGDGDLDVFVGNKGQPNKVWLNDGMASFSDSDQELGLSNSYAVALGDLDGDGDLDAFVGNNGANGVWLNDGAGHFTKTRQRLGSSNTRVVTLEDLDGDGDLDAFVGNSTAARVWLNDGSGKFKAKGRRLTYSSRHVVALGDLDGDGHLDVFAGSWDRGYKVWLNDGKGKFRKR